MTNTIREFLQGQEESTVRDVAAYGIESGVIGELIYTKDILNFFDDYEDDIEAVVTNFAESMTGNTFYDITDMDLLESLNKYTNTNTSFTTTDEMLELLHEEAFKQAEKDNAEEWEYMDEEEIEELVFDYMDDVEVLPTKQDKINFVCLSVELVAQDMVVE